MKLILALLGFGIATGGIPAAGTSTMTITSMQELAECAAQSGNAVTMKPGVYQMGDLLTEDSIAQRIQEAAKRAKAADSNRPQASMLIFSGSDNRFDLSGVTIEVDTRFLSAFKRCYICEFLIAGNGNTIGGLTVTDIGNLPTACGGNSLSVYGDDNILINVTLNVSGSSPYGYGDLLGKGGKTLVAGKKHSGLLVCGTNTKLLGCKVITRAVRSCLFHSGRHQHSFRELRRRREYAANRCDASRNLWPGF